MYITLSSMATCTARTADHELVFVDIAITPRGITTKFKENGNIHVHSSSGMIFTENDT